MPDLTVRSFAELISLPAYEQIRILHEQKYPRQVPQAFKIPYYKPVLNTIKEYFRNNNDSNIIRGAIIDFDSTIRLESKRNHNKRVLNSFSNSFQATRSLIINSQKRYYFDIGNFRLRLSFDLNVTEHGILK